MTERNSELTSLVTVENIESMNEKEMMQRNK